MKRIFYLDFVRAIATVIIVIFHFNCYFQPLSIGKIDFIFKFPNGDWGVIGVALFFIISGSALMYTYGTKLEFKKFIYKRFKSIYPMFWVAYILTFFYMLIINLGIEQLPKNRFILSVIGMDGYLLYLIPNFYRIGEWFLGAIILIYLLFPILRVLIKKNKTIANITLIIFLFIKYYILVCNPFQMLPDRNILVCIFNFLLGMYFVEYVKNVKWYIAVISFIIFIIIMTVKINIPVIKFSYISAFLLFLVLIYISKIIKNDTFKNIFNILSKRSYAIFLLHHVIIMETAKRFEGINLSLFERLCLLIFDFICVLSISKILVLITNNIENEFKKTVNSFKKIGRRLKMSKFNKISTSIEGVYIIEPTVFGDNRGYFMETYSKRDFEEIGLNYNFVQDNQSKSKKGVLRGLHFQKENSQAKLVRCIKGKVFDVAVDLRPESSTYGKWEGVMLSEENKKMFMIPRGFAHGFLVLSDEAEFTYKCDDVYNHEAEGGLAWNDKEVGINWPLEGLKENELLTSEKDGKWPTLSELRNTNLFKNL